MAESSSKVAGLVDEIAAASNKQAQGIEEVNKAVAEMDKVTQQNAANAEESASASEEMNAQAEQMKTIVADLTTIVGGSGNRTGSGQVDIHTETAPAIRRPGKGKRKAPGKAKALAAPGRKQAAQKEVNPEEVIPLDDRDFEDF